MIRKHKSSIATFFGIYLAVTLVIGGAVFMLYRSNKIAQEKVENEMAAAMVAKAEAEEEALRVAAETKKKKALEEEKAAAEIKQKEAEAKAKAAKMVAKVEPEKKPVPEKEKKPEIPQVSKLDLELEKMYPAPEIRPLIEIVGNWRAVPLKAYPPFVNIKVPVELEIKRGGAVLGKAKLPVGSSMIPVRLSDESLILTNSRNSGTSVTLPVSDTNFKEKIEEKYNAFVAAQSADALAKRKAEKDRRLGVIAAESAVSKYNDGSDSRFDVLKASIRRGEAGFYQIESAGKWRWSGEEKIDGEKYQIAFVMMVSESAFGVTEKELKVLIQGDKVVSWIDVKTGEKL